MNDTERISHLERLVAELTLEVEYLSGKKRPKTVRKRVLHHPGEDEERKRFIRALRKPCMDCGERDLRVIEFHHRDPATKLGDMRTMLSERWSEEQILSEVRKCDPLCPTCHRKSHL